LCKQTTVFVLLGPDKASDRDYMDRVQAAPWDCSRASRTQFHHSHVHSCVSLMGCGGAYWPTCVWACCIQDELMLLGTRKMTAGICTPNMLHPPAELPTLDGWITSAQAINQSLKNLERPRSGVAGGVWTEETSNIKPCSRARHYPAVVNVSMRWLRVGCIRSMSGSK
jgi:hypothetical protein